MGGPAGRARPTISPASSPTRPIDGDELDVIDFNLFFLLLIDAGGDTTRNLVAGGIDALFAHPEQLAWLTEDLDARLAPAVEELLRWVSPVVYMRRTAQRDTELGGVPIAAGQKVVMYYGSANRDPEAFGPTADELDLARTPNDHIAFGGGGPHFCLGAHIARVEIHALLRELLDPARRPRPDRRDRMAPVDVHLRAEAPADHLPGAGHFPRIRQVVRRPFATLEILGHRSSHRADLCPRSARCGELGGTDRGVSCRARGEDDGVAALIDELHAAPDFTDRWSNFTTTEKRRGTTRLAHPVLGPLRLNYEVLLLPDDVDEQRLITWLSADDATAAALTVSATRSFQRVRSAPRHRLNGVEGTPMSAGPATAGRRSPPGDPQVAAYSPRWSERPVWARARCSPKAR